MKGRLSSTTCVAMATTQTRKGTVRSFWLRQGLVSSVGKKTGAGEGIRTLDPNLGKVVLYP